MAKDRRLKKNIEKQNIELVIDLGTAKRELASKEKARFNAQQTIESNKRKEKANSEGRIHGVIGGTIVGALTITASNMLPLWGYAISEILGVVAGPISQAVYEEEFTPTYTKSRINSALWSTIVSTLINSSSIIGHYSGNIENIRSFQTQTDSGIRVTQGEGTPNRETIYVVDSNGAYTLFSDLETETLYSIEKDQATSNKILLKDQDARRKEAQEDLSNRLNDIHKALNPKIEIPSTEENNN